MSSEFLFSLGKKHNEILFKFIKKVFTESKNDLCWKGVEYHLPSGSLITAQPGILSCATKVMPLSSPLKAECHMLSWQYPAAWLNEGMQIWMFMQD